MVIKFDLSPEIPANADIKNAVLSIFFATGTEGDTISTACRLIKEWDESTVTWMSADSGVAWDSVGGDYSAENAAQTGYAPVSSWEDYEVTDIVQQFIDDTPNYGFLIISDLTVGNTHRDYCSSEYTDADSLRPKLTITYTSSGIIPGLHSPDIFNGLLLCKNSSGIKLFIPFTGHYNLSLYNLKGKKIETICGYNEQWYQLKGGAPSNGVYIIQIYRDGKATTRSLLIVE